MKGQLTHRVGTSVPCSIHRWERKFHTFCLHSALGAEDVSMPQIASEKETQKETLNVLLLHEMTRIRNVRRNSKHFPMNKVDFLMNNVDLRT